MSQCLVSRCEFRRVEWSGILGLERDITMIELAELEIIRGTFNSIFLCKQNPDERIGKWTPLVNVSWCSFLKALT